MKYKYKEMKSYNLWAKKAPENIPLLNSPV